MYSVGSPMLQVSETSSCYEEVTREAIQQREQLQKSIIRHTNQMISQINKSLKEMESILSQKLSPVHLRMIIGYIREDIQPVAGFINRISNHAELIGKMKKEHELKLKHELRDRTRSVSSDSSTISATTYLIDRNARRASDNTRDNIKRSYREHCQTKSQPEKKSVTTESRYYGADPCNSPQRLWTPPGYKKSARPGEMHTSPTRLNRKTSPKRQPERRHTQPETPLTFYDAKTGISPYKDVRQRESLAYDRATRPTQTQTSPRKEANTYSTVPRQTQTSPRKKANTLHTGEAGARERPYRYQTNSPARHLANEKNDVQFSSSSKPRKRRMELEEEEDYSRDDCTTDISETLQTQTTAVTQSVDKDISFTDLVKYFRPRKLRKLQSLVILILLYFLYAWLPTILHRITVVYRVYTQQKTSSWPIF